jgi:hypothetical protein
MADYADDVAGFVRQFSTKQLSSAGAWVVSLP